MGKGDKKTRRGKIVIGSSGVRRSRKKNKKGAITTHKPVESKEIKAESQVKKNKKTTVKKKEEEKTE